VSLWLVLEVLVIMGSRMLPRDRVLIVASDFPSSSSRSLSSESVLVFAERITSILGL